MVISRQLITATAVVGAISIITILLGLSNGKDALQHAGAFVTFLGVLTGIPIVRERLRFIDKSDILREWANDPSRVKKAVRAGLPASAKDGALRKVEQKMPASIQNDVKLAIAQASRRHENALWVAESLILGTGTLVWGFGDWWFEPPIWLYNVLCHGAFMWVVLGCAAVSGCTYSFFEEI
jgi:hypothetical protein